MSKMKKGFGIFKKLYCLLDAYLLELRCRRRGCGFLGELAVCLFSVGLCLRLLLFSEGEAYYALSWIGMPTS